MPNKTAIEWTDYTSNPIAPVGGGWVLLQGVAGVRTLLCGALE